MPRRKRINNKKELKDAVINPLFLFLISVIRFIRGICSPKPFSVVL